MKNVSTALLDLLATREFYYVTLFTITLRGGTVLRYTDGDADIIHGGNTYSCGGQDGALFNTGMERITVKWNVGLEVDTIQFNVAPRGGMVGGITFNEAARIGIFDGAEVDVEYAFMPTYGDVTVGTVLAFAGKSAEVDVGRSTITFTVNSHLEILNKPMPRNLFQPGCSNTLFDGVCALVKSSYAMAGTVLGGGSKTTFTTTGLTAAAGYYTMGVVVFNSGHNTTFSRTVKLHTKSGTTSTITVLNPLPANIGAGDTFTIYPGCDKTKGTCSSKFNNLANFRGYPYIPENETAL